jgi:pancreatic triacylglycerol lipase
MLLVWLGKLYREGEFPKSLVWIPQGNLYITILSQYISNICLKFSPLFSVNNPDERLDAGDAEYVECIHTNGGLLTGAVVGALGIGEPICQADFFPNGGNSQPGCLTNTCAHLRAVSLYADAVLRGNLWANQCNSTFRMSNSRCQGRPGAFIGDLLNALNKAQGIFYLETNRNSPFGQGVWP